MLDQIDDEELCGPSSRGVEDDGTTSPKNRHYRFVLPSRPHETRGSGIQDSQQSPARSTTSGNPSPPHHARSSAPRARHNTRAAARKCVRHELLRHCLRKLARLFEQCRAQPGEAVDLLAAGGGPACIDRLARFIGSAPCAHHIEILQRETERIDHCVATVAGSVCPMLCEPFAHGSWQQAPGLLISSAGVHAGRRRRNRQAKNIIQQPFAAKDGRRAVRVGRSQQSSAPSASKPPRSS